MRREQKLLVFLRDLQTDLMHDDNIPLENFPQDNLQPSDLLRKVCRKLSKIESQTIRSYYEFGLALLLLITD
jgi:hypothetical protein